MHDGRGRSSRRGRCAALLELEPQTEPHDALIEDLRNPRKLTVVTDAISFPVLPPKPSHGESERSCDEAQKRPILVAARAAHLFVLPANPGASGIHDGATVSVTGVIAKMPDGMPDRLKAPGDLNGDVYIYATGVGK